MLTVTVLTVTVLTVTVLTVTVLTVTVLTVTVLTVTRAIAYRHRTAPIRPSGDVDCCFRFLLV